MRKTVNQLSGSRMMLKLRMRSMAELERPLSLIG